MSNSDPKSDFMLFFHGTNWDELLSPEETRQVVANWYAWFDRLIEDGRATGGHPLTNEGKVLSGKRGQIIADGPFAEAKEAIAGYFYLRVADLNEAVEIARECPGLEHGALVEVRPVADMCAVRKQLLEPIQAAA